jgi:hypothetical protein
MIQRPKTQLVRTVFLWCWIAQSSQAFVAVSSRLFSCFSLQAQTLTTADLGSTTESRENYDIVKVDLDDGRDYPIYIGTGYSEDEGELLMSKENPGHLLKDQPTHSLTRGIFLTVRQLPVS